jgi:hypothetical protein
VALELDHDAFPDGFDSEALERGHAAMQAIVPSMEKVRLIVTPDFEQAVRDSLSDQDCAASYAQDRGNLGTVMARVLPKGDGTIDVVIDSRVVASGQEIGVPEQTFKHEGLPRRDSTARRVDLEHRKDWTAGQRPIA